MDQNRPLSLLLAVYPLITVMINRADEIEILWALSRSRRYTQLLNNQLKFAR